MDYVVVGRGRDRRDDRRAARARRARRAALRRGSRARRGVNEHGLTIEGPVEQFTARVPAVSPDELPDELGAVLLAVKAQHTGAALDAIAPRLAPGRLRRLAPERRQRAADRGARGRGADRRRVRQLRRGLRRPGPHLRRRPGRALRRRARRPRQRARGAARARPAGREEHRQHPRLPLGEGGVRRDALRHRRLRPLDRGRARRAALPRRSSCGLRARCSPLAPVAVEPFDGFDPDDLDGSVDRLVEFNRRSAKTHSGIYRDLAVRKRKAETAILEDLDGAARAAHARAHPPDRGRRPRLRGGEPRAARRLRAPRGRTVRG